MDALRTLRALVPATGLASMLAACASPLPAAATSAEAALREASEAGGAEDAAAAFYLALAERELSRARLLQRVHDAQGARSLARRAAADAEVARLLALEAAVRGAAARAEQDAQAIFEALESRR